MILNFKGTVDVAFRPGMAVTPRVHVLSTTSLALNSQAAFDYPRGATPSHRLALGYSAAQPREHRVVYLSRQVLGADDRDPFGRGEVVRLTPLGDGEP